MKCLAIKIMGFKNIKEKTLEICSESRKISTILDITKKHIDIEIAQEELMIICDNKQLYLDEEVPEECKVLMLFPLALGGTI
ncbi:MAG: hypothetical protein QXW05_02775 [Ignisphaera sp.]